MKVKSLSRVRLLATPRTAAYQEPTRLLGPWDFPGKSTGVGCQCLLLHAHQAEPNLTAPGKRSYACFAKSLQSCPTLHGPVNCSPLGSSVHGNLLKWAAMPSARGSSRPRDRTCISCGSLHLGRFSTTEPPGQTKEKPACPYFPRTLPLCFTGRFTQLTLFPGGPSFSEKRGGSSEARLSVRKLNTLLPLFFCVRNPPPSPRFQGL